MAINDHNVFIEQPMAYSVEQSVCVYREKSFVLLYIDTLQMRAGSNINLPKMYHLCLQCKLGNAVQKHRSLKCVCALIHQQLHWIMSRKVHVISFPCYLRSPPG